MRCARSTTAVAACVRQCNHLSEQALVLTQDLQCVLVVRWSEGCQVVLSGARPRFTMTARDCCCAARSGAVVSVVSVVAGAVPQAAARPTVRVRPGEPARATTAEFDSAADNGMGYN